MLCGSFRKEDFEIRFVGSEFNSFGVLKSLKVLQLQGCISSIPTGLFSGLRSLEELDLSNNMNLKIVKTSDFEDLKTVKSLDLSCCEIASFPHSFFQL